VPPPPFAYKELEKAPDPWRLNPDGSPDPFFANVDFGVRAEERNYGPAPAPGELVQSTPDVSVVEERKEKKRRPMPVQPRNFHVGESQALPGSEYDNMPEEELVKLIRASHQLKTGRSGNIRQTPPPTPKRVIDLSKILGGL